MIQQLGRWFATAAVRSEALARGAKRHERQWLQGVRYSRQVFATELGIGTTPGSRQSTNTKRQQVVSAQPPVPPQ